MLLVVLPSLANANAQQPAGSVEEWLQTSDEATELLRINWIRGWQAGTAAIIRANARAGAGFQVDQADCILSLSARAILGNLMTREASGEVGRTDQMYLALMAVAADLCG